MCICVSVHVDVGPCRDRREEGPGDKSSDVGASSMYCRGQLVGIYLSFSLWDLGIELWSSTMAAGAFTGRAI